MVVSLERGPQGGKLVEQATTGPNVASFIVAGFVNLLGGHIIGRSDMGFAKL